MSHRKHEVPIQTKPAVGTGVGAAPVVAGKTPEVITPSPVVHVGAVPVAPVAPVAAVPVAPVVEGMRDLSLQENVVREPEKIIEHKPIIETEVLTERPIEVKREHHIQPIIHETERRIQPIIKTEATTEQPVIVQDRNVMEAPIVERAALPAGLGPVERTAPEGVIHAPKIEREIINERPVEVKREHHIQPIIHEREHRIQPIIKTEVTAERPILERDRNIMEAPVVERAPLPAGLEAVDLATPEGIVHKPKVAKDVIVEHPVRVVHEHHVQPIIHEREHHIQPIIKTEITTEQKLLNADRNVMMEPVVERAALPAGLEAVERAGPEGVLHRPKLEKEVIVEHPVRIVHEHHVQPIIHEREHHIQPIIKTQVTAEQRVIEQEHTVTLPPIIEPPVVLESTARAPVVAAPAVPLAAAAPAVVATTELYPSAAAIDTSLPPAPTTPVAPAVPVAPVAAVPVKPVPVATTPVAAAPVAAVPVAAIPVKPSTTARAPAEALPVAATPVVAAPVAAVPVAGAAPVVGSTQHKATMGQKLKGALKKVQGNITNNPATIEEGKLLASGVDPATAKNVTHGTPH